MAGLGTFGVFEAVSTEAQAVLVDRKLIGVIDNSYAVLPTMLRWFRRVIVKMASIGAYIPQPFAAAYTASKFGLAGSPLRCGITAGALVRTSLRRLSRLRELAGAAPRRQPSRLGVAPGAVGP
jgi:NADP-dependent 3-hydroxy acid dehydrogenase YdfG